jgi:hypothetical protein
MKKPAFVLQALNILSLETILKLTKVLRLKHGLLNKAAGEELISWEQDTAAAPQPEGKVLQMGNRSKSGLAPLEVPPSDEEVKKKKEEEDKPNLLTSDVILWQREITRETGEAVHKMDAVKGYQKATEMYVVKSKTEEGKEKIRFASTDGILINKKQA